VRRWMVRAFEEGGPAGTVTLFLCYILLIGATGIPNFLQENERRAREAAEKRRADEVHDQEKAAKERRDAIEAEVRRQRPAAPAAVHGPNGPARPDAAARNGPRPAFDYLPAEQRRMLQPGPLPKEKTR
jgi:hypothetical protein